MSHNIPDRREYQRKYTQHYRASGRDKKQRVYNYETKMNFLMNVKAQIGCKICEADNPIILEFHHVNMQDKNFSVGAMSSGGSWEKILKEIEKCDVFCCNHHRLKHEKYPTSKRDTKPKDFDTFEN